MSESDSSSSSSSSSYSSPPCFSPPASAHARRAARSTCSHITPHLPRLVCLARESTAPSATVYALASLSSEEEVAKGLVPSVSSPAPTVGASLGGRRIRASRRGARECSPCAAPFMASASNAPAASELFSISFFVAARVRSSNLLGASTGRPGPLSLPRFPSPSSSSSPSADAPASTVTVVSSDVASARIARTPSSTAASGAARSKNAAACAANCLTCRDLCRRSDRVCRNASGRSAASCRCSHFSTLARHANTCSSSSGSLSAPSISSRDSAPVTSPSLFKKSPRRSRASADRHASSASSECLAPMVSRRSRASSTASWCSTSWGRDWHSCITSRE